MIVMDRRTSLKDLEKVSISRDWIEWYKEEHKSRAFQTKLKGGLLKPRHPHRNLPYCNICDTDLEQYDECFLLYVGGHLVPYHTDCIANQLSSDKIKNIILQDRGYRKKRDNKILIEEPEVIEPLQIRSYREKKDNNEVLIEEPQVIEPLHDQFYEHIIQLTSFLNDVEIST
jgi:hypothetical protein